MNKEERLFIRTNGDMRRRLEKAAEIAFEGNLSLLAREAFKEKLEKLSKRHPELKEDAEPAAA